MAALDDHRDQALGVLADAYARDLLTADSLELRVEQALLAPSPPALRDALFGLPSDRWRTLLRAPRWTGLQLDGGLLLATQAVRASWVLGRSRGCDVCLAADEAVSRRHARVTVRGGRWTVEDLDSSNGTWVNGAPVVRAELRRGDVVALGETIAQLVGGPR